MAKNAAEEYFIGGLLITRDVPAAAMFAATYLSAELGQALGIAKSGISRVRVVFSVSSLDGIPPRLVIPSPFLRSLLLKY